MSHLYDTIKGKRPQSYADMAKVGWQYLDTGDVSQALSYGIVGSYWVNLFASKDLMTLENGEKPNKPAYIKTLLGFDESSQIAYSKQTIDPRTNAKDNREISAKRVKTSPADFGEDFLAIFKAFPNTGDKTETTRNTWNRAWLLAHFTSLKFFMFESDVANFRGQFGLNDSAVWQHAVLNWRKMSPAQLQKTFVQPEKQQTVVARPKAKREIAAGVNSLAIALQEANLVK